MTFPYIRQIHVNNCFAFQNIDVPKNSLDEFKHIIITGQNGSGKTTILNRIALQLNEFKNGKNKIQVISHLKGTIAANKNHPSLKIWEQQIKDFEDVDLFFMKDSDIEKLKKIDNYIFSSFKAHRKVDLQDVSTVSKETQFVDELKKQNDSDKFTAKFKQYLVNKKVYEAFDYMNSKEESINQNRIFFANLAKILQNIFDDKTLELEFVQESFEFYIKLKSGLYFTFNQLSEGFSAFISILMDLLMRVDLMRKSLNDYSLDPEGIVIIDEPETHFHIKMQYEILPLLTELFPKVQFIIATHSPAVISSIKNAVVFDLSNKEEITGWQVGSSYSELMIKHFGLENEFSSIADKILLDVNDAIQHNDNIKLKQILTDNENYLTASLRFEIENQIIAINSKKR